MNAQVVKKMALRFSFGGSVMLPFGSGTKLRDLIVLRLPPTSLTPRLSQAAAGQCDIGRLRGVQIRILVEGSADARGQVVHARASCPQPGADVATPTTAPMPHKPHSHDHPPHEIPSNHRDPQHASLCTIRHQCTWFGLAVRTEPFLLYGTNLLEARYPPVE